MVTTTARTPKIALIIPAISPVLKPESFEEEGWTVSRGGEVVVCVGADVIPEPGVAPIDLDSVSNWSLTFVMRSAYLY